MLQNIKQVAISHIIVLVGTGGTRAIAFLTSIILARSLGAQSFGQFSLFQSAMFICWHVPAAFDTAFVRYAKDSEAPDQIQLCLAAATRLKILFTLFIMCLSVLVWHFMKVIVPDSPEMGYLFAAGMICGGFLSFIHSIANAFRVKEKFAKYSLVQGLYNLTILLLIVTLAYILSNINVTNTIAVYISVAALFCIISLYMVIKIAGNPFHAIYKFKRLIFSLSRWSLLIAIAYYIFCRLDIIVLSYFYEMKEVGVYSAAFQLTMTVSILIAAMGTVFLPRAVSATKSPEALKGYLIESIIPICVVLSGIAFLYAIAPFIFKLLFTNEYSESVKIFRILLLGYIVPTFYNPFSALFYAADRPQLLLLSELFRLLFAMALLLFLVPRFGAVGAAFSFCIVMFSSSLLAIIIISAILKKKFEQSQHGI